MKKIKLVIINLLIFSFLLILVDPIIKSDFALIPDTNRSIVLREFHPNLSVEFKNRQQVQNNPNAELKLVKINTDKDGFLTNSTSLNESDDVDIIFFGGSTTASLYVDEDLRWTKLVNNNLSTTLNRPIKILNSSLSGNNSMHSNLALIAKGIEKSPKIAVIMNVVNDIGLLANTNSYFDVPATRSIINNKYLESNDKSYYNRFSFFIRNTLKSLYPNLYGFVRDRLIGYNMTIRKDEFANYRKSSFDKDVILNEFSKSINLFISICKNYNIEPVLMTQFNLFNNFEYVKQNYYEIYRTDEQLTQFIEIYNSANDLLRDIAFEQKIEIIDLDRMLPKTKDNFVDAVHLNNNGSITVSEIITQSLIKLVK